MPTILLTGGTGYIGSHTAVALLERGYHVVSADNLYNSYDGVVEKVRQITGCDWHNEVVDLADAAATEAIFQKWKFDGIIHFAALKSVPDSVANPAEYYKNNFQSLLNIIQFSNKYNIKNILFSSSCSVYGNASELPVTEATPLAVAESPYAYTKVVGERMVADSASAYGLNGLSLRYFNPAGAHPSCLIGEQARTVAQNLVPVIVEAALGQRPPMKVFGTDYPTRDGSCVRDFIHVCDIAEGHVLAYEYLARQQAGYYDVFNLGTGDGTTVLEMLHAFEEISGLSVPHELHPRRAGDVMAIYANRQKAEEVLGWTPRYGIRDIMRTAFAWQQKILSNA